MEAEAQPIVEDLKLQKDSPSLIAEPAPTITFTGEVDGLPVHLACNGASFPLASASKHARWYTSYSGVPIAFNDIQVSARCMASTMWARFRLR